MAKGSQTAAPRLQLRRTIPAPREKVFQAWTRPEALMRWCAPGDMTTPFADVDLRVGGRFHIHMQGPDGTPHRATGTYREISPPEKLVFTWAWEEKPDEEETLVTLEFRERGRATDFVLTHERFPSEDVRDRHAIGWGGCLDKLAGVLAT